MAWIELHQSLPTHKKTIEAAAILGIQPTQIIGHLCCFWLWALDNAEEGVLYASRNALRNRTIALASQWHGDPDEYVAALIEVGFLDESEDEIEIHDWYDYAGRLIEQRKSNRERQRRYRERKKEEEECNDNVTRDNTVTSQKHNGAPNRTVPNQDQKTRVHDPLNIQKNGNTYTYPDEFEAVWEAYPRKKEKKAAWRKWRTRRKEGVANEDLLAAAKNYAAECKQTKTENGFIKYGATFFGPDEHFLEYINGPPEQNNEEGQEGDSGLIDLEEYVKAGWLEDEI